MLLMASMSLVAQSNSFFESYLNAGWGFATPATNGYILASPGAWARTDNTGKIPRLTPIQMVLPSLILGLCQVMQ